MTLPKHLGDIREPHPVHCHIHVRQTETDSSHVRMNRPRHLDGPALAECSSNRVVSDPARSSDPSRCPCVTDAAKRIFQRRSRL
jgi:hypothetical protein